MIDYDHDISAIDADLIRHGMASIHLVRAGDQAALVDCGTGHSLPNVQAALAQKGIAPEALRMLLFGLAMDYEVFLLARIVELHERGVATDEAVRLGLQRSGRIITSAALLMIIVFSGFVAAQVLAIKETGVALVLAIAIDATLVRMLLVPATMSVLGEWNWWAPRWMKCLHARYGIAE